MAATRARAQRRTGGYATPSFFGVFGTGTTVRISPELPAFRRQIFGGSSDRAGEPTIAPRVSMKRLRSARRASHALKQKGACHGIVLERHQDDERPVRAHAARHLLR